MQKIAQVKTGERLDPRNRELIQEIIAGAKSYDLPFQRVFHRTRVRSSRIKFWNTGTSGMHVTESGLKAVLEELGCEGTVTTIKTESGICSVYVDLPVD